MNTPSYTTLMQAFVMQLGATDAAIQENSGLEFEHDGLRLQIYPCADARRVLIDIELFHLNEAGQAGHDATTFKLLHQLNNLARVQGDALVSITLDGMLMLSHNAEIAHTNATQLVNLFNQTLEAALSLRALWTSLDELVAQRHDALAQTVAPQESSGDITIYG